MSYLITVFVIGLLIFVHELGHLLAAGRAAGIPISRFSVGFGPVFWSRRWHGVEYCLSLIPLGGYVMPECEDEKTFMRIPVARRIVFWLGGPAANFASAAVLVAVINVLVGGVSMAAVLIEPARQVVTVSAQILAVLPTAFVHPDQLSGIVGIVAAGKSVMDAGAMSMLKFAVLLNVNLAIFNLLPIAPLDGGKILCALLEKIHPGLARLQTGFALAGLALLVLLMLFTTVLDVMRQLA